MCAVRQRKHVDFWYTLPNKHWKMSEMIGIRHTTGLRQITQSKWNYVHNHVLYGPGSTATRIRTSLFQKSLRRIHARLSNCISTVNAKTQLSHHQIGICKCSYFVTIHSRIHSRIHTHVAREHARCTTFIFTLSETACSSNSIAFTRASYTALSLFIPACAASNTE